MHYWTDKDRPDKRLYSIKEVAPYLGRSKCAVRKIIWIGKLPYVKDGKRILLDIYDMDGWIEKNKTRLPIEQFYFFLLIPGAPLTFARGL